jgi:hypothetical protein
LEKIIKGINEVKMDEQKKPEEKPVLKDHLVETKHSVRIDGKEVKYTVITGLMILKEETVDHEKEMKKDLTKFIKDAS